MKIYRCDFYDHDRGALVSWHASRQAAERALRDAQRERGQVAAGPEGVRQIDLPTDRQGLIAWLNANFDSDNG